MTVRTRFAPSPTGYLHIGGARTALYCWLFARKNNGKLILRIEDTDRERSTQESIQAILDSMDWLGVDYDEGPFYQSKRFDRYHTLIEQLLSEGKAYRCTCSIERLDTLREQQILNKQKPRYDGNCRDKNITETDQAHVIRFRTPLSGNVKFHDEIRGTIVVDNSELDDLIILRSDGVPTYNFCVVCDDWDMQITHVIRGDDHINNTPRQIHIMQALNAPQPSYAHLPMILGDDGKRLSKRHGAVSVMHYREQGYLPDALINYLVRLGWSHGDQEIFTREEMINYFNLAHISKSGASVNVEKLDWINQHHLKNTPASELASEFSWHLRAIDVPVESESLLLEVIKAQADRCKTLTEMAESSKYFFQDVGDYDNEAVATHLSATTLPHLEAFREKCTQLENWDKESLKKALKETVTALKIKFPELAQPLRIAMTGNVSSPSIDTTLAIIGKNRVLERLAKAIEYFKA